MGESDATWEWDGVVWRPAANGPVREYHAMSYDIGRGVCVVFGGAFQDEILDDTWEYDGLSWSEVTWGVPSPRYTHAMTYDSWREVTLMYGGGASDHDLWAWDGQAWTLLFDNGAPGFPQNRSGHTMVFDSRRGVAMLFGGRTQGGVSNDLWEWDGAAWSKVSTPDAPPRRADHAMAYDPDRHRLILFGGQNEDGDWLSDTWEYILPEPPCYADLDGDGDLTLFDFLAYVNLFNAGADSADCDQSGALDLFDFHCFTNAFNEGC
jgi:hypothetical protein